MAKIIIELDFEDKPRAVLNIVKGAIYEQLKEVALKGGMPEENIKIRIEE